MNDDNIVTFDEMRTFENNDDVLVVDVRERNEIENTGKIGGSVNIPLNELQNALKELSNDEFIKKYGKPKPAENFPLIFSCFIGGRAAKALTLATQLGFNNAKYYKGSWKEWEKKIKEVQ